MRIKRLLYFLFFSLLLLGGNGQVYSFEKTLVIGRGDRWSRFTTLDNVEVVRGKFGDYDLVLKDAEYKAANNTDLLLHFNESTLFDGTGNYRVKAHDVIYSSKYYRYGGGSGGFLKKYTSLELVPSSSSLFWTGNLWGDFSIEFWLYPANLEDGEKVIFWTNVVDRKGKVFYQQLKCYIEKRHLKWEFVNFFVSPVLKAKVVMEGLGGLIPRTWSHHLLRFDSSSGLFEYLVDGRLEDVKYVTTTGREDSTVILPYMAGKAPANILIGKGFTGFLDEFRITRSFVRKANLKLYGNRTGVAVSNIIDMGYSDTRILQIGGIYDKPSDSDVYFYYRVSNKLVNSKNLSVKWMRFSPGDILNNIRGRYLQFRLEFFPNGRRDKSPRVSQLSITYEPKLPPPPPVGVYAVPGDGEVHLYWRRVNESSVRGYLIYYGDSPGTYLGEGAKEGDSPIDVGDVDNFRITGLENGKLYSFSVVAYDDAAPRHLSDFSEEVTARPSRIER